MYEYDNGRYKCRPLAQNVPINPNTLFVIAFFEGEAEPWVVGSFGDIPEVARYYKDSYEQTVQTITLYGSQTPLWIVCSEHMTPDSSDSQSIATGPFFAPSLAQNLLDKLRDDQDFLGGEALALLKP